ncbi:MAG: transposase [Gemmatimonadales bacterium]
MRTGRRTTRLQHHDYAQANAYFVTMCTWQRAHVFGEIVGGRVELSRRGQVAQEEWLRSARIRPEVELDSYVVMPNHLHGIVCLNGQGTPASSGVSRSKHLYRASGSLGSMIAAFKQAVTLRVRQIPGADGQRLWQRNYYEHVIRTEAEMSAVRRYIEENPLRWVNMQCMGS